MNELKSSFPINNSENKTKAKSTKKYIAYVLLAIFSYFGGRYFAPAESADATEVVKLNQATENEPFSEQALLAFMKKLEIKYPETVLSQARLETGNFTSDVFKENHNLFGMKVAGKRPTSAIGTNRNHAKYRNWKDSVVDYALFQSYIIAKLPSNTSDSYREYIQKFYSETGDYLDRIDRTIKGDKEKITLAYNSAASAGKSL
jgi:uncharacterized FlgJ-related protein